MTFSSDVSVKDSIVEGTAGEDYNLSFVAILDRVAVFTGRAGDPGFAVLLVGCHCPMETGGKVSMANINAQPYPTRITRVRGYGVPVAEYLLFLSMSFYSHYGKNFFWRLP